MNNTNKHLRTNKAMEFTQSKSDEASLMRLKMMTQSFKEIILGAIDNIFELHPINKEEVDILNGEIQDLSRKFVAKIVEFTQGKVTDSETTPEGFFLSFIQQEKSKKIMSFKTEDQKNLKKQPDLIAGKFEALKKNKSKLQANHNEDQHKSLQSCYFWKDNESNSLERHLSKIKGLFCSKLKIIENLQLQLKNLRDTIKELRDQLESNIRNQLARKPKKILRAKSSQVNLPGSLSQKIETFQEEGIRITVDYQELILYPKVHVIRPKEHTPFIGGPTTLIAVKNSSSYLIATKGKGYILIENNELITGNLFLKNNSDILDLAYIPGHNYYLILQKTNLYVKKINKSEPEVFIARVCGSMLPNRCIKYSGINDRILISYRPHWIMVVNPLDKVSPFLIKILLKKRQVDFSFFGDIEQNLLLLNEKGTLQALKLDYEAKKSVVINRTRIPLLSNIGESCYSLAVGSYSDYACVSTRCSQNYLLYIMRYLVFRLKK